MFKFLFNMEWYGVYIGGKLDRLQIVFRTVFFACSLSISGVMFPVDVIIRGTIQQERNVVLNSNKSAVRLRLPPTLMV